MKVSASIHGLRKEITTLLPQIDSQEVLSLVLKLLATASNPKDWWISLSDEEKAMVEEGLEDLRAGRTISHEELMKSYGL